MHKDSRGNVIDKENFYLDLHSGRVFYFTGEYDERNNAIFQSSSRKTSHYTESFTSELVRIGNSQIYLSQLKEDLEWMKEKLSGLEELSQSQPK